MIGTDEMSSTGMDISESFRAEDLSKTDFFDFVTAPDMGIGIGVDVDVGVGVSLHAHHHHHHHHSSHEGGSALASMTHDGSGGARADGRCGGGGGTVGGSVTDANSNGNTSSDPTLQSYEFWHNDKEHSRLDSTIFEDLDRYCWQQQHQQQQQQQPPTAPPHHRSPTSTQHPAHHTPNPNSPNQQQQQQQHQHHQQHTQHHQHPAQQHQPRQLGMPSACSQNAATNSSNSHNNHNNNNNNTSASSSSSMNNNNNNNTNASNSSNDTDGQIYTITVLNGNEPWLKREPEHPSAQLPSTLDLDSLLGGFPGYIKSEYPYDDSAGSFGAVDSSKDSSVGGGDVVNGLAMAAANASGVHHSMAGAPTTGGGGGVSGGVGVSQRLPSLVTAISLAGGGAGAAANQHLAQFQNNNNDWHMADHNAEQNSAESLLRSALQGKGYSKGLHMQNGIALMPPSPSVKDDEMRRILFPGDTDTLSFADSSLSAAQIFDDTQSAHLVGAHSVNANGSAVNSGAGSGSVGGTGVSSIIVDDMFLSLENAFSDDFEKIKRIANEVQQFCGAAAAASDYGASDVMMQISPVAAGQQLPQLHSPGSATAQPLPQPPPPPPPPPLHMQAQQQQQQQQQQLKTDATAAGARIASSATAKTAKKYKRSATALHQHNNNNNPNVINHNSSGNSGGGGGVGSSINSSSAVNSNANSSHANGTNGPSNGGGSGSSNSSNSPTHCNGQRKERSLHYCSICSKGFKDKYSVNVHIRTHTGEKPFACSLCGKSFRQKAHLAKHYQTHMAQKNNGNIVKGGGSASKHHRSASAAAAAAAAASAASSSAAGGNSCGSVAIHQRQLSALGITTVGGGRSAAAAITAGLGGPLNGPVPTVSAGVLPPANGLLANSTQRNSPQDPPTPTNAAPLTTQNSAETSNQSF